MMDERIARRCRELHQLFEKAPMKATFNMRLSYAEDGSAIFLLPYDEKFNHSLGAVHGGVIAALLDNAGWFTAATQFDSWIVTSSLDIHFFKPVALSSLQAKGELVRRGQKTAFTTMKAFDETNNLVAAASASFCVTK